MHAASIQNNWATVLDTLLSKLTKNTVFVHVKNPAFRTSSMHAHKTSFTDKMLQYEHVT